MAWAIDSGRRNYYRNRRVGKRVVTEYFGGGAVARLAAALDDQRRRARQDERETKVQERQLFAAGCKPLEKLIVVTDALVRAELLLSGFHRHHFEWRRVRHVKHR